MKRGHDYRPIRPSNVKLEGGYEMELVVDGLSMPTSLAFDDEDGLLIAEAGRDGLPSRILRVKPNGHVSVVARGFNSPLLGMEWHGSWIYVTEGGYPGRVSRVSLEGMREVLIDGLPTAGDNKTGHIDFGPDGRMYFPVGTATNSSVVGQDNRHWLRRHPLVHDISHRTLTLAGRNFDGTGAFHPFGSPSRRGEKVGGRRLTNGAIMRARADGSHLEVYADGLRNPIGIRWIDGCLYAVNNGMENRGSRPIPMDSDSFWHVRKGGWYGWPDYASGIPVYEQGVAPVVLKPPILSGTPIAQFPLSSYAGKFDVSCNPSFGFHGCAFIAMFGDCKRPRGLRNGMSGIVRLNISTGEYAYFLKVKSLTPRGPGVIHPIQARFNKTGSCLYIVDYGIIGESGPVPGTGTVWRIKRRG